MTFLNQPVFYFATARKLHVAFAALFRNVHIRRFSEPGGRGTASDPIRVPIAAGPTEKWLAKINQYSISENNFNIARVLPRMSYECVDFQPDPTRQLSPLGFSMDINQLTPEEFVRQLNPVPYDFHFELNIMTKTLDDGLQIIEQICPNFAPSQNLNVKDIPELGLIKDIPIIFVGLAKTDTYEGEVQNLRVLTWKLSFIVKGYLYPGISDAAVIKKIFVDIYTNNDMLEEPPPTSQIVVAVDPLAAMEGDDWTVVTRINEPPTPYELPVHTMGPSRGAYTIIGHDVIMTKNINLVAESGTYNLTGNAQTLKVGKGLYMGPGSYILHGKDAGLLKA